MSTVEMGQMPPLRSYGAVTVDTNALVVYTVQTGFRAQVIALFATDDAADARTLTVTWTDTSASVTYSITVARAIAAATTLVLDLYHLALEAGDTLNVTGSAVGIHVTVTVAEYARSINARAT